MAHYFDTSALVKLVVAEAESSTLLEWARADERVPVTSDLARTELLRAVHRRVPEAAVAARDVLDAMTVLTCTTDVFETAARLGPPELRSLDAIHLAAALQLGDDLEGMVVYDDRLAEAAEEYGIRVFAPR